MRLSVIIPVFNERQYLPEIIRRITQAPLHRPGLAPGSHRITELELIAIDDASTDGSREWLCELARDFGTRYGRHTEARCTFQVFLQEKNRGKGAAIRFGIAASKGELVLVQDADLEYSPSDYPQLLAPLLENKADVVFGSRFLGSEKRVLYFWHSMVNHFLTTLTNMLCDTTFTDMETCYKVMRGDLARSLYLTSDRFGIEPELTARLAKARVRLFEVPISYNGRTYEEGKKIGPIDGLAALGHILRYSVLGGNPFKKGERQALYGHQQTSGEFYTRPMREILDRLPRRRFGRILEIGSGLGAVTQVLAQRGPVVATDVNRDSVSYLSERFQFNPAFKAVQWDATLPPAHARTPKEVAEGGFDLIVAANVLEHMKDDAAVVRQWKKLLAPRGTLVLLVPYSRLLFSPVDQAVGHLRRYDRGPLEKLVRDVGLKVGDVRFVNGLGLAGWFVNSTVFRRAQLPDSQVLAYSALKPLLRPVERVIENFAGLSIVITAHNRDEHRHTRPRTRTREKMPAVDNVIELRPRQRKQAKTRKAA